ncbi:MAG: hydroxymethylbilane synthase [Dehalococcoidales bacterium]|nr:hydroxymethylbilane synthase [Dehalococcoidales bacterium]
MSRKIVVGSRGSKLALIQTNSVVARIRETNPGIEVSVSQIATRGDRERHIQLDAFEGSNIFVKELEEALLDGRIDLAVHSLKDMPTQIPSGLYLAAVTERVDPRDVLISRGEKLAELPPGARLATGSLRRAVQLGACRPDLEVCGVRGNVDTRLAKAAGGEFDGVILAAAGLARLGRSDRVTEYLSVEHFLPAVGQGALGIEARLDDKEIAGIVLPLNHLPAWQSITAERSFLTALGGGCRAPIAALGTVDGTRLRLDGMVAGVLSKKILRSSEEGNAEEAEELGVRLAQKLVKMGAEEFLAEAKRDESR